MHLVIQSLFHQLLYHLHNAWVVCMFYLPPAYSCCCFYTVCVLLGVPSYLPFISLSIYLSMITTKGSTCSVLFLCFLPPPTSPFDLPTNDRFFFFFCINSRDLQLINSKSVLHEFLINNNNNNRKYAKRASSAFHTSPTLPLLYHRALFNLVSLRLFSFSLLWL